MQFLNDVLLQEMLIIIASAFAGSFTGQFYKSMNNNKKESLMKFLSKFLASLLTSVATILIMQAILKIEDHRVLSGISMFLGFSGHKKNMELAKGLIDSLLKKH